MDQSAIEAILAQCEESLARGDSVDLRGLGFWKVVAAVKRHPEWVETYAARIATIDRQAFDRSVRWRIGVETMGTLLWLGTAFGLLLLAAAARAPRPWKGLLLLAGTGLLTVATHDLTHLVVGRALGVRFSEGFLGGKLLIEPGLKIDYASYLRAPPRARAWMHASGAIVTKIVPFAVVILAWKQRAPRWATVALLASGVGALMTDVFLSTRYSDWMRFRREMRIARALERDGRQ